MRQQIGAGLARALMRGVSWRLALSASTSEESPAVPLPEAIQAARAILVVSLAEAGDMVLLTPFLRELRRVAPRARISLVSLPGSVNLVECSRSVDEIKIFRTGVSRLLRPLVLPGRARRFARAELRDTYDVAIVPRWDTDHHLATAVALYSGAPCRVGFTERSTSRRSTLNAGFDALLTHVIESRGPAHEVERHLTMLRALGAEPGSSRLELTLTDADRRRAAERMPPASDERMVVALGVGAADPKRRWPAARFIEVGRSVQRAYAAHVIVVGGREDAAAQGAILRELTPHATGLAGLLTFRETAAALERCSLFVGNDSAPMHLAAAVGVPCVEVSCHAMTGDPLHNNAPERFGPWEVQSTILRPARAVPPCDDGCRAARPHCILEVESAQVIAAATAHLATGKRDSSGVERRTRSHEDLMIGDGETSRA